MQEREYDYYMFSSTCFSPECDAKVNLKNTLCPKCKRIFKHEGTGTGPYRGAGKHSLSPAQATEIVRRMRRFEDPFKLAKEFNVTVPVIKATMSRTNP